MTKNSASFTEGMAKLKAKYLAGLPQKLQLIVEQSQQLQRTFSAEACSELHRSVHNLIGTSGTLGFMELSQAARSLEVLLKPLTQVTAEPFQVEGLIFKNIEKKVMELFTVLQNMETFENTNNNSH